MVEYISLNEPIDEWADLVIKMAEIPREDTYERMKQAGYDIHTTAPWLQNFYLEKSKMV